MTITCVKFNVRPCFFPHFINKHYQKKNSFKFKENRLLGNKINSNKIMAEGSRLHVKRNSPNILITGTPGVGKSTMCKKLAELTGLRWLEISQIAVENNCLEEYDKEYKCPILDEDKLLDGLENIMGEGGNIVDYHSSEFFPERWFDYVFVLRTDNTMLYDRLTSRGYAGKKLQDNIQCEIFGVARDEAENSYKEEIVHELLNNNEADFNQNVSTIVKCLQDWFRDYEQK